MQQERVSTTSVSKVCKRKKSPNFLNVDGNVFFFSVRAASCSMQNPNENIPYSLVSITLVKLGYLQIKWFFVLLGAFEKLPGETELDAEKRHRAYVRCWSAMKEKIDVWLSSVVDYLQIPFPTSV